MARRLKSGARIDEFTSVVDRTVAASCSVAISKYIRKKGLSKIILATCHYDVVDWLEPDWIFDTANGGLNVGKKKDQTFALSCYLAGSRRGQCSASIIISRQTSIKVQDAGSPFGEGNQLGLHLV